MSSVEARVFCNLISSDIPSLLSHSVSRARDYTGCKYPEAGITGVPAGWC